MRLSVVIFCLLVGSMVGTPATPAASTATPDRTTDLGSAVSTTPPAAKAANASVVITSPANNSMVNGSALQGSVSVTNFTLDPANIGNQTNKNDSGHYHVLVNGIDSAMSGYNTFNVTRLKAGSYLLRVELRNNNHSQLVPNVYDEVNITVLGQAPGLVIESPQPNAQINSASITLVVNVTFFKLNASAMGKANVPGVGHYHVYLNGVLAKMGASASVDLTNLTAAQYNMRVELRNNDHSELQPPVFDQVTIKILAGRPAIAIVAPIETSVWNSTTVPYALYTENFKLNSSAVGKNNTPGEGHYHILIDATYVGFAAALTGNLTNLTSGMHSVRFELHENNHSALTPEVWDTISIQVNPPGVKITSPANGTKLTTNTSSVTYVASNFTLNASAIGKAWNPGEGHVHILVDGNYVGLTASTTVTVKDLQDGMRKITFELHNNDHTALQPNVAHSIWVDVNTTPPPPPVPTVSITSPGNNTKLNTNTTTISYAVTGFKLNGSAMGGANKPSEGHVHVIVDGTVVSMNALSSIEVTDLKDGTRKITVELVNNDHTPLSAAVSDSVWVQVNTSKPGGPSLAMLKPTAGQEFTTQDVPVEFEVKNFKLVEPKGQGNQTGAGHVHLVVNGGPPIWIWNNSPSSFVLRLGAGQHTIKGLLVNNDHSPVSGIVEVSVTVTVDLGGQQPAPDNRGLYIGLGLLILLVLAGLLLLLLKRRKKEEPRKEDGAKEGKEDKKQEPTKDEAKNAGGEKQEKENGEDRK